MRVFYDARQLVSLIGNVTGGPANTFDVMIAQDQARQIAGSIEGTIAFDLMNAPSVHNSGEGVASSERPLPPMPCSVLPRPMLSHVAIYHGKAIAKAPLDAFVVVVLIRSSRNCYH